MTKCAKCGVEVETDEVYTIKEKTYCEDCAMVIKAAGNPGKRCGQ